MHPKSSRPDLKRLVLQIGVTLMLLAQHTHQAAAQNARVVDRIVAIVNDTVITQSTVDTALQLSRLKEKAPAGDLSSSRDSLLQQIIEERLIRTEIESFPGLEIQDEILAKAMRSLDDRFAAEGGLASMAPVWQLSLKQIEEDVRYQLRVQEFMKIRFFSFVNIETSDVERYYREKFPAQLLKEGISKVPPLEEVRQQIHDYLAELRVKEDLDHWLEDLRQKADISILPEGLRLESPEWDRTYDLETGKQLPKAPGGGKVKKP